MNCSLNLHVTTGYIIKVNVTKLDLAPKASNGQCTDFIQIFDGTSWDHPLSGKMCGQDLPSSTFLSRDHVVKVWFVKSSNKSNTFVVHYDRVEGSHMSGGGGYAGKAERLQSHCESNSLA